MVRQFAHMHNVRASHIKNRARDLAEGLHLFETHEEPDRETLKRHLEASSERLEAFFERYITGDGKVQRFKKGPIPYSSHTRAITGEAYCSP